MDYWQYRIRIAPEHRDVLLAFLTELPFESFEEIPEGLDAYLPVADRTPELEAQLETLKQEWPFSFQAERLEHRNWNEEWERNFPPIRVDDFCGIRADFHPPFKGVAHEIVISPKMAFGTGHHATTYMMIEMMGRLDWKGQTVLDYGCGTGILAILAARLGAAWVDAVDIEEPAYENTLEHARINGVADRIHAWHGVLETVPFRRYDTILANINRHVILASLSALYERITPPGTLLISGILADDEPLVLSEAEAAGFFPFDRLQKGEWICRVLKKNRL